MTTASNELDKSKTTLHCFSLVFSLRSSHASNRMTDTLIFCSISPSTAHCSFSPADNVDDGAQASQSSLFSLLLRRTRSRSRQPTVSSDLLVCRSSCHAPFGNCQQRSGCDKRLVEFVYLSGDHRLANERTRPVRLRIPFVSISTKWQSNYHFISELLSTRARALRIRPHPMH